MDLAYNEMMSTSACSFCRKTQDKVMQLVAAPPSYICDECAMLAVEMISIEHPDWGERLIRTLALLPKGPGEKN
jgi:ATP-dependent protease Clp ATPase subunit